MKQTTVTAFLCLAALLAAQAPPLRAQTATDVADDAAGAGETEDVRDSLDVYLNGQFSLLGRDHDLRWRY
jgi:hypothetical protein